MNVADLLDASEVAVVLGLNSVSVYARRHDDVPVPVVDKSDGHTKLWLRAEVEAWRRRHPGRQTATT